MLFVVFLGGKQTIMVCGKTDNPMPIENLVASAGKEVALNEQLQDFIMNFPTADSRV